jgi:hypothetical protein
VPHRRRKEPSSAAPPRADAADPHASKLAGMRPVRHDDDDERPTREDRDFGRSPLDIPVPLPRFLKPKAMRKR